MMNKNKIITKEVALKKLERYCTYQDRCHQEVRNKLMNMSIFHDDPEEIIAVLIEEKILNEERFARSFARGKFKIKNWGRVKIEQQLALRNISDYCTKQAMKEIDEQEYEKTLTTILHVYKPKINHLEIDEQIGKMTKYGMEKGFEMEMVIEKVREVLF